MARDGALPAPARLSGALAIGLLLLNVGNPTLFSTITATSVVVVYLAYLLVAGPLLVNRLRGRFPAESGRFSLGRWGVPLNGAAVLYGIAMIVNIAWPRAEIHDLAGSGAPSMLLFPIEFVGGALVIGWLCRLRLRPAPALEPAT
nr:hypothetical protein [Amycolatopsis sp. CA-128772]